MEHSKARTGRGRLGRSIAGALALWLVSMVGACGSCGSSSTTNETNSDGSVPQGEAGGSSSSSSGAGSSSSSGGGSSSSSGGASSEAGTDASEAGPVASEAGTDASYAFPMTANLLVNPGAELGPGSPDGSLVASVPDWITTGEANVVQYGASGGFPDLGDADPPNAGMNFFTGGPNDALSTFTQIVSLSPYESAIAQGGVTFTLSGYLGGYSDQDDDCVLTIYFLSDPSAGIFYSDAGGLEDDAAADAALPEGVLGSASIGPVTPDERADLSVLISQMTTGPVPVGTVAIEAQMVMTRYDGSYNDGYADDLSFTLTGN